MHQGRETHAGNLKHGQLGLHNLQVQGAVVRSTSYLLDVALETNCEFSHNNHQSSCLSNGPHCLRDTADGHTQGMS